MRPDLLESATRVFEPRIDRVESATLKGLPTLSILDSAGPCRLFADSADSKTERTH